MNRIKRMALSTVAAGSVAAGALAFAGAGTASASPRAPLGAVSMTCTTTAHNYAFPNPTVTYLAGRAGSVSLAPVNSGTIKVTDIRPPCLTLTGSTSSAWSRLSAPFP
jgi:hypothetical protein